MRDFLRRFMFLTMIELAVVQVIICAVTFPGHVEGLSGIDLPWWVYGIFACSMWGGAWRVRDGKIF